MAAPPSPHRPRPLSSRKRFSVVRLSTDTTSSLPAYSRPASATDWAHNSQAPHSIEDQPPDYPQSAEEADQEDDFVPLRGPRSATTRRLRHRRGDSTSQPASPSVDDLLERSVLALELSTSALLQSIDTQSSVSAIANDRIFERSLDRQTRMLDMRMRGSRNAHEGWMDDLDQVMKGVDGLFADGSDPDAGVSRSLPTENSLMPPRRHGRPPMHLPKSKSDSPYLHLSTSELDLREGVRPPRALTQYVSVESASGEACEATADPESIYLPSTTGLRAAAQIRTFAGNGTRPHLRQSASTPVLDANSTPSTPAYNMLSHLVTRHSSRSPSRTASPPASIPSSDNTSRRTARRYSADSIDSSSTLTGLRRSRSNSRGGSSASTETPPPPPPVRAMTPPMEEPTPSPSSSSASSLHAFRTMQSLRKILDEAPPDPKGKRPVITSPRRRFQPRSPSVAPSSGTSTATASVSRLLTRSSHHGPHLTAQARHSSLKKTPAPTPPVPGTPSTAPSTPRNVSFAELPDSYSGRSRRRGRDKEREKGKGKDKGRGRRGGWWSGWFSDVGSSGGAARHDERMEDRMIRGWGRPGMGNGPGGTDEWML